MLGEGRGQAVFIYNKGCLTYYLRSSFQFHLDVNSLLLELAIYGQRFTEIMNYCTMRLTTVSLHRRETVVSRRLGAN